MLRVIHDFSLVVFSDKYFAFDCGNYFLTILKYLHKITISQGLIFPFPQQILIPISYDRRKYIKYVLGNFQFLFKNFQEKLESIFKCICIGFYKDTLYTVYANMYTSYFYT